MNSLIRHFFTTCCLLGILPISAFAQIPRTFSTVGTATLNNPVTGCNTGVSNCFQLTPNASTQIGAIWDNTQLNLSQNFDISFCLNFGTDDAGADGIVFVLQQAGLGAVGGSGGGQGYLGIANPSLGVEFDIFDNTAALGDIADDHIAVNANGVLAAPLTAPAPMFGAGVNAEDGNFHTFRVLWNAQCQTMSIYADGVLRNTLTNDIVTNIFGGNANVFWGFTASTGGATNQQQVCINGFKTGKLVNIGNDTTLCSTQSVNLDATTANATAYLWSTGATTATITAQGVNPYVVSVTVGGCVIADTMFISACQTDLCNRKQGNIWYFGFSGAGLDFNTSPPTVLTNGQVNTFEGVSTMADLNGNLLFYTDGITVWDRNHTIMTNGTGLFGDPSSAQSGVIVPHPARSNIYYVFTTDVTGGSNGCRYSVVDMNLRGGLGDILSTEKNVLLFTNHTEKLTAIKHCNGRDYWVATHEFGNNNYRVYRVDNNGLNTTPLIQAIGSAHTGAGANQLAYMRFSVDGSKMAATIFLNNTVEIFDFNNSTGVFSNPISLTSALWAQTYGVEFSADARLLYISGLSAPARIHQVDLSSNNAATILASATQIARSPGQYMYGALQLAPDGRIYVCRGNGSGVAATQRNQFLAVINNPSNIGTACNYQDSAINLISGRGYLGLPNFIQSSFASPAPSLQGVSLIGNPRLDTTCTLPQTLTYSIERPTGCGLDSIRWSLNGTVLTAFTDTFATINISTTGSYDLVVNVYTACQSGSDTLTILSTNPPTSVALGNDTILCQNATLTLTAPAGFAGYLWQDGSTNSTFTVTATGNYSVTVSTLCGQTYQDAISVQYSSITLTAATSTDVSCPSGANGTVRSTPSNGVAPYRYLWSNGQTGAIATGLLPNNYCLTVSDLGNCTATVCQSVTQLPAATVSTSPDTAICLRDSANLRVNGAFSVTWTPSASVLNPNRRNTLAFPTVNTTYQIDGFAVIPQGQLVTNGGFESGNTGFTSSYVFNNTVPVLNEGQYAVLNNPNTIHNGFTACPDHTTGSGNMMVINGGTVANQPLWCQDVNVAPNTDYAFQAWLASANGTTPGALLQFSINGQLLGNPFSDTAVACLWQDFTATWNSATATTASICIVNQNLSLGGNDFLLDDIILAPYCPVTRQVAVSVNPLPAITITSNSPVCAGNAINLNAAGGNTYSWSGINAYTSNAQNPSISAATTAMSGNYKVTVTTALACSDTASTNVFVDSLASNITSTNVSCFGGNNGTASLTVSYGSAPISFVWSNNQTTQNITGLIAGIYTVTITNGSNCRQTQSVTITEPTLLQNTLSQTNVSCTNGSNGTATASVFGGVTPYVYAWGNGQTAQTATGLSANAYTLTVTDANLCTNVQSVTITQPNALQLTISAQNLSCFQSNDGRATANALGGTTPYSYAWSNNTSAQIATGLSTGIFTLTVTDANACSITSFVSISQPSEMLVFISKTDVSCNGRLDGTATAQASDAVFPYTYLWSNGQNTNILQNVGAGIYTVTITDFTGCQKVASATITQPAAPIFAAITSVSQASCNGLANGSATVNGTGGTPNYTYLWSNGQTLASATGLVAGAYVVTLTDQRGCAATANTNISQPTALVATASVFSNYNGADVSCTNSNDGIARVIVSGGAGGYGYRWSSIPAQLTPVASGLLPGNYTVTVTDLSGCSVTRTVTLRNPVLLAATFSQVNVFCKGQNTGQIVVNATAGTGTLGINGYEYAIFGANQQGNVYSAVNQWFGLVAGTYTVIVRDGNNCQVPVSIQITEPSALSISTQSTAVLCNGTGTGTSATTITGGTSPYTYLWSDGQTARIATGLLTGGYAVTATDANGCDIAAQVVITEPAALAISVSVNGVSCNSGNDGLAIAQPTGGIAPYRYRWSNGQTAQTGTNFIAGVHAITLTDANNCVLVSSFTVTEPLGLVSSITVQNLSCAASANGTATALAQGGTAPYTYAWINGQTTQTATGLNASIQRVVITDALGCQTQAQTTLTQPSVLSAQITAQTATLCANSADGTATVSPNGGTSGYTYLWSNGQTTTQATGLAANQSYMVTVTDANGCNTSISTTIPNPSSLAITNTTHTDVLCRGAATGRATVFVSGGTLPYTYAWSNGQNSPVATGLAANLYSVTISDANGCATTTQVSIAQPTQALSMFVNTNPTLCAGGNTGQAVAVPGGGTPLAGNTYRYLWSNGQTTRGISGLLSGAYTVTVTDANGCTITNGGQVTDGGSSNVQAQVLQNPTCLGGNEGRATASGSSSNGGNVSYLWSNGQTIQTITGLTAGVYSVVVTDTTNCQATASVTVTDGIDITASAVVNNVSCFGLADGDLQVTSSPAGVIYEWDNQFVATNGNLTDLAAGEYTVTISIAQGCRQDFTFTVTEPQSITLATAQTRAITCYDGNNGAANVSVTGGSPAYSYLWSNGVQTDAIDSISAGGYSVVVTDANGCTATTTIAIVEPAELVVTVTSTGLLCSNSQNGQIAVGATGGTLNLGLYEYGISTDSTPVSVWQTGNLFPNLSAGDFYVQVRDINGCTDTAQINVKAALPFFITSATADTTIQFLDSLQLMVGLNDTTNNTVSSNWILLGANGDTLASNKYKLWIAPQDAGQYLFRATNQNGCIVDTTINIGVLKNRFANAPTGFTPNNDGTNDKFFVQAANDTKIEKIVTFRVYDRWGELVHEALDVMPNDDTKGWDGTFKGKEMNPGVFAWYAEVKYKDGFIQTIKGDVTLLK